MNKQDWIIIYLSVLLSVFQFLYTKSAVRASYLQGQADLYQMWTVSGQDVDDGPYVSKPVTSTVSKPTKRGIK